MWRKITQIETLTWENLNDTFSALLGFNGFGYGLFIHISGHSHLWHLVENVI